MITSSERDCPRPIEVPGSIPIPTFEQVGDGELEARQKVFSVETSPRTDDFALCWGMANFHILFIRVDNPGDLCAAVEEIVKSFSDLD